MIPPRLVEFASRIGLTGLAIALLVAAVAVQTVRLEGFKLWPFSIEGANPRAKRLGDDLAAIIREQGAAEAAQVAVNDAAARIYKDVAERIDDEALAARTDALADADRFIAGGGVRPAPARCPPSQTNPAAGDRGAGGGEGVSQAPVMDGTVTVPAEDVRICTVNTLQAEAGRAWALELEAASAPKP